MRSDLFGSNLESATAERFTLQNSRMLRVALDGEVMARQGGMVAYQGQVDFAEHECSADGEAGALIGRGSGEAFQLVFNGQGFVVVQASEGRVVVPHTH